MTNSDIEYKDILTVIQTRKWRWAGHLARRHDNRWTQQITDPKNTSQKERPTTEKVERPTTEKVERPTTEKVERPTTEKVERPTTEKVERPTTEKVERPTTEKVERPTTEKVERPTTEKVERPTDNREGGEADNREGGETRSETTVEKHGNNWCRNESSGRLVKMPSFSSGGTKMVLEHYIVFSMSPLQIHVISKQNKTSIDQKSSK